MQVSCPFFFIFKIIVRISIILLVFSSCILNLSHVSSPQTEGYLIDDRNEQQNSVGLAKAS